MKNWENVLKKTNLKWIPGKLAHRAQDNVSRMPLFAPQPYC